MSHYNRTATDSSLLKMTTARPITPLQLLPSSSQQERQQELISLFQEEEEEEEEEENEEASVHGKGCSNEGGSVVATSSTTAGRKRNYSGLLLHNNMKEVVPAVNDDVVSKSQRMTLFVRAFIDNIDQWPSELSCTSKEQNDIYQHAIYLCHLAVLRYSSHLKSSTVALSALIVSLDLYYIRLREPSKTSRIIKSLLQRVPTEFKSCLFMGNNKVAFKQLCQSLIRLYYLYSNTEERRDTRRTSRLIHVVSCDSLNPEQDKKKKTKT